MVIGKVSLGDSELELEVELDLESELEELEFSDGASLGFLSSLDCSDLSGLRGFDLLTRF